MATAVNHRNTGSSNSTDSDRIEVISDEVSPNETPQPTVIPISSGDKKEGREGMCNFLHYHRPYAASSNRIVQKCGRNNVIPTEVPEKSFRYFKDIGNTILNTRWRWILITICVANAIAYVVFAGMWMLIAVINDDHDEERRGDYPPCIYGTTSFTGYLLLSMTTLNTIGYGVQYPTECQPSWMVLTLQALTSVAIEGALITAVFVKMSKPNNRSPLKIFSRKAVLEKQGLLLWPLEIVHKITYDSPMWTMSPQLLYKTRFEILVILEGDSITTGQPSQSQTSYMNKEISWGYRFVPCVSYDKDEHKYVIDDDKFNEVIECDTPLCSAQELLEFWTKQLNHRRHFGIVTPY
ncbi:inward rectifier potassium channel [Holotrichia oblita]|uniref:Inward rectifier potassium channel n=1 Tax=Holotrichia oblita TaxID=644536 RepID=A0ACB9TKR3_HOLOL|nr:inward rectifier potassium channel [Holotrichia oblita]